jgi:isopenicillin-N N-acyltransferase like protein
VAWPVVFASGGPRERGRAYGEQAAERIQRSIALYDRIFRHYTGLAWDEVRSRAGAFVAPIDVFDVELLPEIEGIAEGARVDAEDVLAINLRTEIMFGLDARPGRTAPTECTALGAVGEAAATGPIAAQNWDWKPGARETCVVLACAPTGGPGFVTVVEAGLLAKCGMNEAGLALVTNALTSSRDRGAPGIPYHTILRRVLTSTTMDEAIEAIEEGPRGSSANYLLVSREGRATNIETTPGGPDDALRRDADRLVHANHFTWPTPRPFKDVGRVDGEDSLRRHAAVAQVVGHRPVSVASAQAALRDHDGRPSSVCAHDDPALDPIEDYLTVASIVADLDAGVLWVTEGGPCEHAFEQLDVAELLIRSRARTSPSAAR